jgi:hypothetical protein
MKINDFDLLCQKAFAQNSAMDDKSKLWQAVFNLDKWYFIMRGNLQDARPYIAEANQIEPNTFWIYAFTDGESCSNYAITNELVSENQHSLYLTIPNNEELIPYLEKFLAQGVKGIYFNANSYGFYSPLQQLQVIKDHLKNNGFL